MKWRDLERMRLLPHELRTSFHSLVHIRLVGHDMDPSRLAYDVVIQAENRVHVHERTSGQAACTHARGPHGHLGLPPHACCPWRTLSTRKNGPGMVCRGQPSWLGSDCTCQPRHQCPDHRQDAQRQVHRTPTLRLTGTFFNARTGSLCWRWEARALIRGALSHAGMEGLLSEEAFQTNAERVVHRAPLMDALNEASKSLGLEGPSSSPPRREGAGGRRARCDGSAPSARG